MLQDRDYYWKKSTDEVKPRFDRAFWSAGTKVKPRGALVWLLPVALAFALLVYAVTWVTPNYLTYARAVSKDVQGLSNMIKAKAGAAKGVFI